MKNFFSLLLFIVAAIGCSHTQHNNVYLPASHISSTSLTNVITDKDTLHVIYKDDILTIIPHGDLYEFDVYSEVNEEQHFIDHLNFENTIRFIMFVKLYPYDASDISDTAMELGVRGYYLELIKEMEYLPAAGK